MTAVAMVRGWAVGDLAAASVGAVGAARAVEARAEVVEAEKDAALWGWAVGSGLEAGKDAAVAKVAEVAVAAAVAADVVEGVVEAWATVMEAKRTSGSCYYQLDSARH